MSNIHHAPRNFIRNKNTRAELSLIRDKARYAKNGLTQAAEDMKDRVSDTLQKSSKIITDTTLNLKDDAVSYARKNPVKTTVIGLTALAGIFLALFFRK